MATLLPPFEANATMQVTDLSVTLPDTDIVFPDGILRPSIARYATIPLPMTKIETTPETSINCPVTGVIRKISLNSDFENNDILLGEGINELLEITPLPFFINTVLAGIAGGVPVFYIGIPSPLPTLEEDQTIRIGDLLGNSQLFYFGAILQDRVCLHPWGWISQIIQALPEEDRSLWTFFSDILYPSTGLRLLKVLNHIGQPFPNTAFRVSVNGSAQTLSTNANGMLNLQEIVGQPISLHWLGDLTGGETESLPVMSVYETGQSSNPDTFIELSNGFVRGHLQVLELSSWFIKPLDSSSMQRFHANSKVEPLVDGFRTFKLIAGDMINSAPAEGELPEGADIPGAHFAGWGFKNFVLDEDSTNGDEPYTYEGLVQLLHEKKCDVHALVNKLVTIPEDIDDEAQQNAILIVIILADAAFLFSLLGFVDTDAPGKVILTGGQVLLPLILFLDDINKKLEEKLDESKEMFDKFKAINDNIALRSVYPARHEDNPLFTPVTIPTPLPITITNFIRGMGTWHQKIQLFKRFTGQFDEDGNQFIGYIGGMDMNGNRLDNFGRQGPSAYHDVHSRITGPGVRDIFIAWQERYDYELSAPTEPTEDPDVPLFQPPQPDQITDNREARHILQISRTLFKPASPDSEQELDFAPDGDNSINQNMLKAIQGAREYIYIEDQYFVPNESNEPGRPGYLDALLEASDHCKRLIVLSPSVMSLSDIPFGHERRASIGRSLTERWGTRVLFGAPMRRPVLPSPGGLTHEGRCTLFADINALDIFIKIGPKARLPLIKPFWIWINGELMLVRDIVNNDEIIDGHPVVTATVIRGATGTNPLWGALAREHAKGSPVTASQLRGIFVHAKTMMVDDILVCVGSANINRRGLFSDGEIGVFSVPEQLRSAPDNPARQLRTELWAEQLGLPPSMGAALLQDPIAAYELFRRHFYGGNRFIPLSLFDFTDDGDLQFLVSSSLVTNILVSLAMSWVTTHRSELYNTFTDPTTIDDPDPTPGP